MPSEQNHPSEFNLEVRHCSHSIMWQDELPKPGSWRVCRVIYGFINQGRLGWRPGGQQGHWSAEPASSLRVGCHRTPTWAVSCGLQIPPSDLLPTARHLGTEGPLPRDPCPQGWTASWMSSIPGSPVKGADGPLWGGWDRSQQRAEASLCHGQRCWVLGSFRLSSKRLLPHWLPG